MAVAQAKTRLGRKRDPDTCWWLVTVHAEGAPAVDTACWRDTKVQRIIAQAQAAGKRWTVTTSRRRQELDESRGVVRSWTKPWAASLRAPATTTSATRDRSRTRSPNSDQAATVSGVRDPDDNGRTASRGQGRGLGAEDQHAVEMYAMEFVSARYRRDKWKVKFVHLTTKVYDLHCVRESEVRHVEVKGTTGRLGHVEVSKNQVTHARSHPREAVLAVVHGITLNHGIVSGGTERIIEPWFPLDADLTALTFRYSVPIEPTRRVLGGASHS
jgi:Domain of unknown function (DUF3883)